MSTNELTIEEIAQHRTTITETLDEEVDGLDTNFGRGIRQLTKADNQISLATPDVAADGETMMYVTLIPHVGEDGPAVAVTDIFSSPDFAWVGEANLIETLQELVDDGHLVVVDDDIGLIANQKSASGEAS